MNNDVIGDDAITNDTDKIPDTNINTNMTPNTNINTNKTPDSNINTNKTPDTIKITDTILDTNKTPDTNINTNKTPDSNKATSFISHNIKPSELIVASVTHKDILNAIFNPQDIVHIRVFSDKGTGYAEKRRYTAGLFDQSVEELEKVNKNGNGIFFVVNCGGDTDESINKINAQFMECDNCSFEEQLEKINKFPLRPSIIIKTRKSYHTYWLLKDAVVSRFRPIQRALAAHFNSDTQMINESRCMRLPGFNHCKEDPVLVTCIFFEPQNRYTQDELAECLPEIVDTPVDVEDGKDSGLFILEHCCDFIKHCITDSKTLSEHDWYAMITNLYSFKGGVKAIHEFSKDYPAYKESDTNKKIKHYIESKTKPITCKVIAEKGFKCPKYESGACDCKSPAALCYKPLPVESLMDLLNTIPVTNNPLNDIPALNDFIKKYLYNQERTIGETFIQHAIKDKFKLTTEDVRSLRAGFSKINKEYNAATATNDNVKTQLNKWYSVTKNGFKFSPLILAKYLKENEKIRYLKGSHFEYSNGVYRVMEEEKAQEIVQDLMLDSEAKIQQILDAQRQWQIKTFLSVKEVNSNPYIINLLNGLYDVISDTIRPHDFNYYSTIQFNVNYNQAATCPLFKKYLHDVLLGNEEQVSIIQEMLGYLLVPITSAQRMFVLHGEGNTGKSVLLHVINTILLGRENVSNVTWQNLGDKYKTAELYGKLANVFGDLPQKNLEDTGIFKALVGEDLITCEEKYKKPFSFKSTARLVFSCNKIPISYNDKTSGFYRRLLIIPFNKVFTEQDRDEKLKAKLEGEADGIFNYALVGLKRLMRNGYRFTEGEINKKELERYRIESDSALTFFSECCELCDTAVMPSNQFYANYCSYCKHNGLKPLSQKNFIHTIMENYKSIGSGRTSTYRTVTGVRVTDDTLDNTSS